MSYKITSNEANDLFEMKEVSFGFSVKTKQTHETAKVVFVFCCNNSHVCSILSPSSWADASLLPLSLC